MAKAVLFLSAVSNSALAARLTTVEVQTEDRAAWTLTEHCVAASGKECWSATGAPWLVKLTSNIVCGVSGGNRHAVKDGGCETKATCAP